VGKLCGSDHGGENQQQLQTTGERDSEMRAKVSKVIESIARCFYSIDDDIEASSKAERQSWQVEQAGKRQSQGEYSPIWLTAKTVRATARIRRDNIVNWVVGSLRV
jgi:hypothetical protein